MFDLAIVIPAYKDRFFYDALNCLNNQTNKNFTVYIGDDNSPYDLRSICDKFSDTLNIRYTRFEHNIGAKKLVEQWRRCIDLTMGEEWLWLFSDDDRLDENCVEEFYKRRDADKGAFDVYRFNTTVIDKENRVIWHTPESPMHESSEEMAYNLLLNKRGNSIADHIYSREIYTQCGGFVFTEYAQGADWAMSILFSKPKGIAMIPNARVYWRYSGFNLSSATGKLKDDMIGGHLQFISWTVNHFEYLRRSAGKISYGMILHACRENLKSVLILHYKGFSIYRIGSIVRTMHYTLEMTYGEIWTDLFQIFRRTSLTVRRVKSIKKFFRRIHLV
jgi:glycosyltransferase involved in cell wall biosynthesis